MKDDRLNDHEELLFTLLVDEDESRTQKPIEKCGAEGKC